MVQSWVFLLKSSVLQNFHYLLKSSSSMPYSIEELGGFQKYTTDNTTFIVGRRFAPVGAGLQ